MKRRILSLFLALCLIVGLLPAVAIPHAHAEEVEEGAALEAEYVLKMAGYGTSTTNQPTLTLTNYDTPVYTKNTTRTGGLFLKDGETYTADYVSQAIADETDWNAKLIWHTGDEGPTLYLNGFVSDNYNEEYGFRYRIIDKGYHFYDAGIFTGSTAPLKIVLQGEDSVINGYGGINYQNKLTIESEGDTKLSMRVRKAAIMPRDSLNAYEGASSGNIISAGDLTINANLEIVNVAGSFSSCGIVTAQEGDIIFNGGTVNVSTLLATGSSDVSALRTLTSGDIIVNGGDITAKGRYRGVLTATADDRVYVNGGTFYAYGSYSAVYAGGITNDQMSYPVMPEGGCFTYQIGSSLNTTTTIQKSNHIKVTFHQPTEHPAVEADRCLPGNTLYYSCDTCGKFFSDAAGTQEIKENSWIIPGAAEHAKSETVADTATKELVTRCTVCGVEMERKAATALDTAYTVKIGGTSYTVTHYDIPVYTVNTTKSGYYRVSKTVETTDEETGETTTTTVTENVAGDYVIQSTTGANADNYNAKLVWHSGDKAPTLYLKDFVLDNYNEELGGKWRVQSSTSTSAVYTAAIHTGTTAPLSIVVESGACVMQMYDGIHYQNDLSIKSIGDASLTVWTQWTGIIPSSAGSSYANANTHLSGNKLTLDANLTVSQGTWANLDNGEYVIRTIGADMVINGGTIVAESRITSNKAASSLGVADSGNLIINGGTVYAYCYNGSNMTSAAIQVENGDAIISNANVVLNAKNNSGISANNITLTDSNVTAEVSQGALLVDDAEGIITVTGGTIESAANHAFAYWYLNDSGKNAHGIKTPVVTVPEGKELSILAGSTKDAAVEIEDTANYGYGDKYLKLEFVIPCAHANTTTVEEPISNASCTQVGSKKVTVTCNDCGKITEDIVTVEKLPHTDVIDKAVEPGCDTTGLTEGKHCGVCGEVLTKQEEIDALGHDWTYLEDKDPTCTETGLTEGEKCANCGEFSIEQEEIPALGHTEEIIPAVDATCTEPGLTAGVKCSVCDETLTAQTEIPALGHTPAEAVKENETATSYESVVYCATCGAEMSRETIETTPSECTHTYTDDNDAVCNNCGYVREMVDTFDFVNYRVVFADSDTTHKNVRAIVYKLGDQTVADPSDEAALNAIDPTAETYWQAAIINKILLTDAGNYVVMLKYNVGTAIVSVPMVINVTADPKLIIDNNNKITVLDEDETHINHRVVVYYIGENTVEDIYDTAALTAIDAAPETVWQKTRINKLALTKGGTYVLHLQYNIGTSAAYTVAQSFTVYAIPTLKIDQNNMFVASDENAGNKNHRVVIYTMGDEIAEDLDIFDEKAVAAASVSSQTVWGLNLINDIEITEAGNYIVQLQYNIESGSKRTIAVAATLYERPVLTVTEDNKLNATYVDTTVITNPRATYYYFGENATDGLDIYDATALKAAATSVSSTIWGQSTINKTVLSNRGNYVIHLDYNEKVGDTGSVKKTVAIATTVYDPTKPTITVDENNKLVAANTNVDATNLRAVIYNLGEETVADPTNETALKAIDSAAVTKWGLGEINKVQLDAANNYVVLLKYNVGTATRTVVLEVTR